MSRQVELGKRTPFLTWRQFATTLRRQFKPLDAILATRDKLLQLKQTGSVRQYTEQFTTTILNLPDPQEDDLVHHYITGLKFYMQCELRKDLACGMLPTLEVAIALAEQYDSLSFPNDKDKPDNKHTDKSKKPFDRATS